jgi:dihydropteroate synthase
MIIANRALILGILNVTPDSFSDGGFFLEKERALRRGLTLVEEGADILDIGGESTRPGATPISAEEELRRVIPVIQELRKKTYVPISIDTSKAVVAQAAIQAGATIINDVSALGDPGMGEVAASTGSMLILMHCQGTPETMQKNPTYHQDDVVGAVTTFLIKARERALNYGVPKDRIILDPGIGFGKTVEHNDALLRAIPMLTQLGAPLLLGHSRKSFLGKTVQERLLPSVAITSIARYHGALLFRVHDPHPHREAVRTIEKVWQL